MPVEVYKTQHNTECWTQCPISLSHRLAQKELVCFRGDFSALTKHVAECDCNSHNRALTNENVRACVCRKPVEKKERERGEVVQLFVLSKRERERVGKEKSMTRRGGKNPLDTSPQTNRKDVIYDERRGVDLMLGSDDSLSFMTLRSEPLALRRT